MIVIELERDHTDNMAHLGKSSPQSDQASTFVISSVGTASPTFLPMPSSATTTVCSPTRSDEALFASCSSFLDRARF